VKCWNMLERSNMGGRALPVDNSQNPYKYVELSDFLDMSEGGRVGTFQHSNTCSNIWQPEPTSADGVCLADRLTGQSITFVVAVPDSTNTEHPRSTR
jgi:hypothetical protein